MNNQFIFIYSTHPDLSSARDIAKILLDKKLIACANIIPGMISIYSWNGNVEEINVVVAIFKTSADLFKQCQREIECLHPYSTPCILQIQIAEGNEQYLNWLTQEIKPI
jgi:periplasmic divalent cation tolerance protein